MKRISILLILLVSISTLSAQKGATEILARYGFTTDNILNILDASSADLSFTVEGSNRSFSEANHTDQSTRRSYDYDSKRADGEKFKLLTINGKEPTKHEIKKFNKEKNQSGGKSKIQLKESDFFVEKDDEKMTVIGFHMPADELPSKLAFMAHCTGYIYINKETGRVTKLEIKSFEPFSLKVFHITDMFIQFNVAYNEEHKTYYATSEFTRTKALILGSVTTIEMDEQYKDIKFN
jgi:hypothetical protein